MYVYTLLMFQSFEIQKYPEMTIISTSNIFESCRQAALCRRSSRGQLVRDILGGNIPRRLAGKITVSIDDCPIQNWNMLFDFSIRTSMMDNFSLIFPLNSKPPFYLMIFQWKLPCGSGIFQLAIID